MDDAALMKEALRLANRGRGAVEPNPLVGAVIARDGKVLARGYHHRFGAAHAEVDALNNLPDPSAAVGATMYVTLEPCCHKGKTPPCTDAIIHAGIAEVVAATLDPNPRVSGRGRRALRRAGVAVRVGVLQEEARYANAPYFKLTRTGRPFVTVKWAMSLDGKIATRAGRSRWISNERARIFVHKLRAVSDAVVVGVNTVVADDPLLTARLFTPQRTQTRVVVDSKASVPLKSAVVATARETPTLVAVTAGAPREKQRALKNAGCKVVRFRQVGGRVSLKSLLDRLGRRRMTNVLVEGGGTLIASFLEGGLADRIICFLAPVVIGGAEAVTPVEGEGAETLKKATRASLAEVRRLDDNLMLVFDLEMPYLE